MSLQRPEILWLLLVLLVPLVFYLLRLPRRRVPSTALFLWERFLRTETLGQTSERFRRAVGFALLAVILAALVAAAAELSVGRPGIDARRLVVLIDVSASMNAVANGQSNRQRAVRAAEDLVESLSSRTEVAVAEAAGQLRVVSSFAPAGREAAEGIATIEQFDGPSDLGRVLEDAFNLWGADGECEIYVFTDGPLPESRWGRRAHAWIAPPAGENAGIVALDAQRRGRAIVARFTLANYGGSARALAGTVLIDGTPRSTFRGIAVGPGEAIEHAVTLDEPVPAALTVRLDGEPDALATDDEACIFVPGLDDLRVAVVWPAGGRHNAYVGAVLASLKEEGVIGPVGESSLSGAALTVLVSQSPEAWPEGGAIVLYPLRGGAIGVSGLHAGTITVDRQAEHFLLDGVELRGMPVKEAVDVQPPPWAEPLAWAGDVPLVWAGETGKTKALVVAMPLSTDGSRLPLAASFPVLMRNACRWMLPRASVTRPGEMVEGSTSRRVGFIESPHGGRPCAFSTLSAAESDLRREPALREEPPARRHPLAFALVALAVVLLPVEWRLFHRRFTE